MVNYDSFLKNFTINKYKNMCKYESSDITQLDLLIFVLKGMDMRGLTLIWNPTSNGQSASYRN